MKNIKMFYKNNRIYCILMGISIFCILFIVMLFILYFFNQTKNLVYGNRLNGIDSVLISKNDNNTYVDSILENEKVDKASLNVKGKIIYVNITLKDGTREDAKAMAIKLLSVINEDAKAFYDINFSFVKNDDETFPFMGYKKSDATIISWSRGSGE